MTLTKYTCLPSQMGSKSKDGNDIAKYSPKFKWRGGNNAELFHWSVYRKTYPQALEVNIREVKKMVAKEVFHKSYQGNVSTISISPSVCHEVIGLDATTLVFWMFSFKSTFSLSSFTFIKRLFCSSLSAVFHFGTCQFLQDVVFCVVS